MSCRKLILRTAFISVSLWGSNTSFATNTPDITCPTVESLTQYQFESEDAAHYNPQTQKLDFYVSLQEKTTNDDGDDDSMANEGDHLAPYWLLDIGPIPIGKNASVEEASREIIGNLELVSTDPFNYEYSSWRNQKSPVCVYQLPGNNTISAKATFVNPAILFPFKQQLIQRSLYKFKTTK